MTAQKELVHVFRFYWIWGFKINSIYFKVISKDLLENVSIIVLQKIFNHLVIKIKILDVNLKTCEMIHNFLVFKILLELTSKKKKSLKPRAVVLGSDELKIPQEIRKSCRFPGFCPRVCYSVIWRKQF